MFIGICEDALLRQAYLKLGTLTVDLHHAIQRWEWHL